MNSLKEGAMWHIDPLLGGEPEIGGCTVAIARQQPANNTGMVFSERPAKQQLNNRGTVCPVRSMQRCYKQES
jgi:hypothetical protein